MNENKENDKYSRTSYLALEKEFSEYKEESFSKYEDLEGRFDEYIENESKLKEEYRAEIKSKSESNGFFRERAEHAELKNDELTHENVQLLREKLWNQTPDNHLRNLIDKNNMLLEENQRLYNLLQTFGGSYAKTTD